ncbi:zinc-finger domain-containing protein [Cohnella lubricantis]|uniref:Zinc-finger domain-containing protein n=1 Tax=Cohnella lubricantis TaxID=2163172 RepID=A0A841T6G6_9BACL|nr:zinc-finger domain-containing protein [Cohnella lubricantis]
MIVRDRKNVLAQISAIEDGTCAACETRQRMQEAYGRRGHYAKISYHCNQVCPIGRQLQELGKYLVRNKKAPTTAPRQQRREWMLNEDEVAQ